MEGGWIAELILIFVLLICSGFFSGSETALTAVSRARIYKLQTEGNRRAKIVNELREHKEALIGTILLGNNLVNIAATAIATSLAIQLFGDEGVVYATFALTLLVLVFSEILPKTFAFHYSERVSLIVAPILEPITHIFAPVTHSIQWFIRRLLRIFGIDFDADDTLVSSTDAIRGTIEMYHQDGGMIKQERDMLGSILDLNEVEVESVMTHRKQMEMIDADLPAHEIIRQVIGSAHSRLPFWQGDTDNIIGILHTKDMMRLMAGKDKPTTEDILELLSPPWFVPEATTLSQQLHKFREKKRHFAVVVDEYGACQGLITLEDILEEIVGDIVDEHDVATTAGVKRIDDRRYRVKGTTTIRDLNRALDWNLPDEVASTVAGLVIHEARSIPEKGANFAFFGYCFTVEEKRANQILQLIIRKLEPEPGEE